MKLRTRYVFLQRLVLGFAVCNILLSLWVFFSRKKAINVSVNYTDNSAAFDAITNFHSYAFSSSSYAVTNSNDVSVVDAVPVVDNDMGYLSWRFCIVAGIAVADIDGDYYRPDDEIDGDKIKSISRRKIILADGRFYRNSYKAIKEKGVNHGATDGRLDIGSSAP